MVIKPSSRSCMVAAVSRERPSNPTRWPLDENKCVLWHLLQNHGSIRACWEKTRSGMWKAFWANAGSKKAQCLDVQSRLVLLDRASKLQLAFRCSRWRPQRLIAIEMNRLQQKMVATSLRLSRLSEETPAEYVARRGRAARSIIKTIGFWSAFWFRRALQWDEHLASPVKGHL